MFDELRSSESGSGETSGFIEGSGSGSGIVSDTQGKDDPGNGVVSKPGKKKPQPKGE